MKDNKPGRLDRREFLGLAAGAVAMAAIPPRVLGANDRIRIGLIGAGDRGQQVLKDALAQAGVECVAVADVYTLRHQQVKALAPAVVAYDDPRKLLDRQDIDAVIIATPLHLHAKYFLDSLASGKDVYCEKTMTWDIPEAVACRDVAEKSRQVVQIGLQHESSGELADARKWYADGLLGKVTMVESWMSRNTPHGHGQWVRAIPADCNPAHVNWDLFLVNRPKIAFDGNKFINWRLFWEFSGGNVTENMVHQIAWIMTALDLPLPEAADMMGGVYSERDGRQVPDTIAVTFEFPNDLTVLWQSTFSNSRFGLGERLLGSDGTVEHISGATDMVTGKYTGGIKYYPEKTNRPQGVALPGSTAGENHMANWLECIRTRNQKTNAPVEIGYKSAVAAHMANLAYRQKRRITQQEAFTAKPEY
ncbi:MAG TPA: Gfo/Idh/MocA family oxidoreductase [Candidatus Eisenbacteria bacterium]|nr:Gfo/Idh/MocA family oxidoreductase [Candidatus Eisenbacteria bacterium]